MMNYSRTIFTISKLIYPKYNPIWFVIYMYVKYHSIFKRQIKYKLETLPDKALLNILQKVAMSSSDVHNCALVHPENVYLSDKILNLHHKEIKHAKSARIVTSLSCKRDTLYVSNTFVHNLSVPSDCGDIKLLKPSKYIEVAQEIDLSLISCPHDLSNAVTDSVVKSYFKYPKLIQVGDIVSVNIKYFCPALFYTDLKLNGVEQIHFKCNKVIYQNIQVQGQFFCVIGTTAIKQSANLQSYIPNVSKLATKSVESGEEMLSGIDMCPYGLQRYLGELTLAVAPFIKSKNLKLKPLFLLQGEEGCGEDLLLKAVAAQMGMHHFVIHNSEIVANVYAQNESKTNSLFFQAKMAAPCLVSIHKFEHIGQNAEGQYDPRLTNSFSHHLEALFQNNPYPVIIFCCTSSKYIPAELKRLFLEAFEVNSPTDVEREENLRWIVEMNDLTANGEVYGKVANKTHGFYFKDLEALVYHAACKGEGVLEEEHFEEALEFMQKNYNESLGAPKVPKVRWADVGGLTDVKEEIIKTINLPLKHPEFFEKSGLSRSGILLFGPPGTGKTLIAKAVATECSLCFLTVKGPELLNMYVGQSEQNVREVFQRARQASPCIIFFDELDSLAPNRGLSGDSGGVMDRVVSQLLAEMDGLETSGKVFVIGATNRPDLIDPALLRPGRFDKLLYVGPCADPDSKVSVLKALTRKFNLSPDLDLKELVLTCPKNVTGADFYGICSCAWSTAAKRLIGDIQRDGLNADDYSCRDIQVRTEDFLQAIRSVKPSISEDDLKYFDNLKRELSSS
ncbi:peroxisome assembly factor 2 isoform X2 [Anthonomus grandis grandis]|uniref:peroxisome assembly factor 2 isoform X2 n=1 Tax=Anthonomus grandis grandis TaxID=2921223 RepID=UPI00216685CB|nr:peroxisome assembly factor 2 isoform X2 [Anthonomus grandis grandis]